MRSGIYFGFCLLIFGFTASAFAGVKSIDLINNPSSYNGKTVIFEGEAVGDIIDGWINVKDKNAAIGIYANNPALLDQINFFGDYKNKGDRLRIKGTFNQACPEHGGDLDIHADTIEIIQAGNNIRHKIDLSKLLSIMILAITMIILYLLKTIHEKTK